MASGIAGASRRDLLTELAESGTSEEGFATQLNVPLSWVQYWVELAKLRRLALQTTRPDPPAKRGG